MNWGKNMLLAFNLSIFRLKSFPFKSTRPVVSQKSVLFRQVGQDGAVPPPHVLPPSYALRLADAKSRPTV